MLRQLIEDGEVVKIRGARIGLPARMNLVAGRLTCNPAGYGFVAPESRRAGQSDVYVSAVNLKEALHGDRVVVRVERVTPKGPEGRIIRVLERGMTRLVGRYEQDGRFGGHVVPFDKRVLHELFIPPGEDAGASPGQMVAAEITRPPTATRNPSGRVLEVLGRLEDPGVDLKVVMAKYGLPDAFPAEVEAEAARVPQEVRPEDVARPHRLPPLDDGDGGSRDGARPRRRDQPGPPAERALAAGRAHRGRGALRARGHAARPGGLPARDLGLLPGPRGADAAARALQPASAAWSRARTG